MREMVEDKSGGVTHTCATCRYRSDEFTSVCVNPDSPKRADFVDAEYACKHWEKRE